MKLPPDSRLPAQSAAFLSIHHFSPLTGAPAPCGTAAKASLIHAETYLLARQRYIERNPVCAALVDDPAHYRWSSYRHNALGQANAYSRPHPLYRAMGAR